MAATAFGFVWRSCSFHGSRLSEASFALRNFRTSRPNSWLYVSTYISRFTAMQVRQATNLRGSKNSGTKSAMSAPPWKEAASLIVVSRAPLRDVVGKDLATAMMATVWNNQTERVSRCDYRVLMVKRSSLSSFMANAYVYPGGLCEQCDFSSDWWEVFAAVGATKEALLRDVCNRAKGPRPPMITKPMTLSHNQLSSEDYLPGDLAYRISAIRETFEETGVLLLTQAAPVRGEAVLAECLTEGVDTTLWRQRLREDPVNLLRMCRENRLCPNVWALHEWWDWLTPISVGHRRYDTMFYICCMDKQPQVVLDQSEVITLKWCTPEGMLHDYSTGAVFLAPPQVYETSRLLNITSFAELSQFACQRATEGCEQWMPVIASASDGAVSLLPGDDLYPEEPDYFGRGPGPEYPFSLEELRQRCQNLHRMEVQGPLCTAYSNIEPPRGHLQPQTFEGPGAMVPSML
ncbi:acyl-coenzyme A diphosphatase NUDT19-like isoform X1 [Dermacentor albipictus]|uniref:acyl-coenzyme A diphosphatase NUDT19-like isoform X1 n=2 Tax=Dermacentor albipictus TaxID=60249 RepID=UPI0038FC594C